MGASATGREVVDVTVGAEGSCGAGVTVVCVMVVSSRKREIAVARNDEA